MERKSAPSRSAVFWLQAQNKWTFLNNRSISYGKAGLPINVTILTVTTVVTAAGEKLVVNFSSIYAKLFCVFYFEGILGISDYFQLIYRAIPL